MLPENENNLLESVENGEWVSVSSENELVRYQEIAKTQLKKDKRISLRINNGVLSGLQKKAFEEGIPYQTLINSILHKFLLGKLREV
ncbi:MAG: hypothetical protein LRY55_08760 [Leadbetterella sp.]|nr:hypothetical protein [Leadbetterella sp.]